MAQTPRQALDEFITDLNRLRRLAGAPSLNQLVAAAGDLGLTLARSTISDKLNAKSLPEWDFVVAFVRACLSHAAALGRSVPGELADLSRWDVAHWNLLRAADRGRADSRLATAAAHMRQHRAEPGYATPRQLPAPVRHFVGRERQLDRLTCLLADPAPPRAMLITAIGGTAGIGKTTLAVHWAHQVADRFPDGQLYVNLRGFDVSGPMTPAEALHGFLEALAVPPERIPAGLTAQAALYRSLLVAKRVLVVLDNARDTEHVRPLLPGSPGCLVVVTSRRQMPGLVAAEGAHPLILDVLPSAEAHELLSKRIGADRVAGEPYAVHRITATSAGLPLALAIVAARAATYPDFSLASLADELDSTRGSLDGFTGGEAAADIRVVFSWSYQRLDAAAARLFRLLGLHLGPDISIPAAASLAALSVAEVQQSLVTLARANLLTEHTPGRFGLHDLLRVYAAELASASDSDEARHAALGRLFDHYLHTAHTADLLLYQHRDGISLPAAHAGVVALDLTGRDEAWDWLTTEHRVLLAVIALAASTGFDTHAWQLAWTVNTFLDRVGAWQDQSAAQQLALLAASRVGDRDGEARAHRNRAVACLRLGAYDEADTHLRQSLDLYSELGDNVGSARAHLNLGVLAERQNHYRSALDHARRAFDLFGAAGHVHGKANALNNIGWYHIQLGDHLRALGYCQEALALHQKTGNGYWQAHAWDSLGFAHHRLGQHSEAVNCYEHALILWREAGERYYEATTLTHVGDTHHTAGEPDAARTAWHRALEILDRLGHPDAEPVRDRLRTRAQQSS